MSFGICLQPGAAFAHDFYALSMNGQLLATWVDDFAECSLTSAEEPKSPPSSSPKREKKMPRTTSTLLTSMLVSVAVLSGCALGKHYSEIDPEGAKEDIRQHNGYYALKSVTPGTTKLVLRSAGAGHSVLYSSSTAANACEGMEKQGTVRDSGRGVVYPWIANMTLGMSFHKAFLEQELPATTSSLQVEGLGTITRNNAFGLQSARQCGPHTLRFQPKVDRAYLVEYVFKGDACSMGVVDATDPDAPLPVPVETLSECRQR